MGYFDGLTAGSFKKDAEGRELFFFWGKFGKGRVICSSPHPEQTVGLEKFAESAVRWVAGK